MKKVNEKPGLTSAQKKSEREALRSKQEREEAEYYENIKVERAMTQSPESFAEFSRLKVEKDIIDARLAILQKELVCGPSWIWYYVCGNLQKYKDEEVDIISDVALKYYKSISKEYQVGDDIQPTTEELIRLIQEAGVNTREREDCLLDDCVKGEDNYEKTLEKILEPIDNLHAPGELSY